MPRSLAVTITFDRRGGFEIRNDGGLTDFELIDRIGQVVATLTTAKQFYDRAGLTLTADGRAVHATPANAVTPNQAQPESSLNDTAHSPPHNDGPIAVVATGSENTYAGYLSVPGVRT